MVFLKEFFRKIFFFSLLSGVSGKFYFGLIGVFCCFISGAVGGATTWLPDSFSAQFTQVYRKTLAGKEQRGHGQIDYAYPGKIKFSADKPDPFIFTSNGHKTWYYYPPFVEGESGELTVQEQGNLWLNQFFDLLRQGPQTNEHFTATAQNESWILKFTPATVEKLQARSAQLKFKTKAKKFSELQEIILTKDNGQKVSFILAKVNLHPSLAADYFEFTPPPKTKMKEVP